MQITIDEGTLAKLGDRSLLGMVYELVDELPEILELIFPQTSLRYRRNRGGPDTFIIYEYNVPCLLKDILYLQANGVVVIVTTVEKE